MPHKTYREKQTIQAIEFDGNNAADCILFCPEAGALERPRRLRLPIDGWKYVDCKPGTWIIKKNHVFHIMEDVEFLSRFEEVRGEKVTNTAIINS